MDSSPLRTTVAAALGVFTLFRILRFHQEAKKEKKSSSSSSSSSSSHQSSSSVPPSSSLCCIGTHHVFPSFCGEDVRRDFLSHIQMEFQRKGITPFNDNKIKRGESIGPELIRAIRESKIAIILLSRNYASSSWCLDELAEIMKCREELGLSVMVVFYKVDPSQVKKLTGDFGKAFRKTCAGKAKEDTDKWRQALEKVATIAGYHSSNWDNEAAMINKIASDISNELNYSTPSSDFDWFVGMRAHLEKMEQLLCLDSQEVRMVGIWGPSGIGKTTIARVAYNQLSNNFQLRVFMENIKAVYTRPCSDDYNAKLQLQQQFLSQITNQKDFEISHLGVAQDRLKDKKVLVILDGVDQLMQLDAMAKETRWFGPGSRIIITSQYRNLFRAHGINHIYKVGFPASDAALQMFCMYAFGQKSPEDGFEELAKEVTRLVGDLPLGLRVMGSYFRRMSKQEWTNALPKIRTSINTEIGSILKFSYDALDDEDKDLFLHISCFFNFGKITEVEELLAHRFFDVRQGLNVLAEKSLISICYGRIEVHNLLVQLGRDIVRKQSIREPGQRQFVVDERETCELLSDEAAGSSNVLGIKFYYYWKGKLDISERAFEGMSNLQFLRIYGLSDTLHLPWGLHYLSRKLRLLHWDDFPMTCLPSNVHLEFLVELKMSNSKLEKLWKGVRSLRNLRRMDLSDSVNLKELPDLSTATNLQTLELQGCSSLVKLPSTIGYTKNLRTLNLSRCSSLINIPSSIGNATNLENLKLSGCSSLTEIPSSFGNAINLERVALCNLLCLVEIPSWITNATNLVALNLSGCSNLVELPVSLRNLQKLKTLELHRCSKLQILPTNINLESLDTLNLTDCSMLTSFPEISTNVGYLYLRGTAIEEVPPWIERFSRLEVLSLIGCRDLVSLPQIPDSVNFLHAEDCLSLERLDCSFRNSEIRLNFAKCFKLNQEARDLIIHTRTSRHVVLPSVQVPECFTHRANGGSLTIKFNEMPLPTSMRFKVCILLVDEAGSYEGRSRDIYIVSKQSRNWLYPLYTQHLYIFEVEAKVNYSNEVLFDFKVDGSTWKIRECGVLQLENQRTSSL